MNSCTFITIIVLCMALFAGAQNVVEQNPPICDPSQTHPSASVTSDTKGVDFGPYLTTVKRSIRKSWYSLVPASAIAKRACVAVQFKLSPDGRIAEMQYESISGDVTLDHAAWGGVMAAEPFPPLPREFKGDHLTLRFDFFYNPSPEIASKIQKSDPTPTDQAEIQDDSTFTADSRSLSTHTPAAIPKIATIVPDTSEITPGRLVYKVDPQYPKEARKQNLQGTVVLQVTVEKNGNVTDIAILSGDLILADSAVDAVSTWKFEPYTQSGSPVQASQKASFNFVLGEKIGKLDTQLPPPTSATSRSTVAESELPSDGKVYRVGPGITPPRAIYAPSPEYSEAARKIKFQGTCVLSLIVGPDGQARDIKVIRALGKGLDAKAVEAVSEWKFQPAMRDGEAVAVLIDVETQFHLY
jgi:TonB family protein